MSEKGSKINLVENDELDRYKEKEKDTASESDGLLSNFKKKFDVEFNGLFFIILSIIVFSVAITIAMVLSIFFGPAQIQPHAAISSDVTECTSLGLEICRQGGSAVDSAIAALLCISIVRPDITGLGGCGAMIIRNHSSKTTTAIDFSCVAPPNAKTTPIKNGYGVAESVAIPGVFSGIKLAQKMHGQLPWSKILDSVSTQLKKGVKVTPAMQTAFTSDAFKLLPANFRDLYQNWASGSVFTPSWKLMNILSIINNEGMDSGITGSLATEITSLGFDWGGKFETAREQKPLMSTFGDYSIYTAPLPSKGGLDLALAIEMLNAVVPLKATDKETTLFYHRLLESMKVSQATTSFLGDSDYGTEPQLLSTQSIQNLVKLMGVSSPYPNKNYGPYYFQPDIESGSGTHISIIDSKSLYVSMTVNLGSKFGSGIATSSGIIMNDAMRLFTPKDDSSLVPGLQIRNSTISNNYAAPGKRPLNQLIPLVVFNFKRKCGVRFAVGGDHGSRSSTGNLQMILAAIYLDQKFCPSKDCMELSKAGLRSRLHVDIVQIKNPDVIATVFYDKNFPSNFQQELTTIFNHTLYNTTDVIHTLNSIGKVQYEIQGFSNSPGSGFFYF